MATLHEALPPLLRPSDFCNVSLPSGAKVQLPLCRVAFPKWSEPFSGFTYGGKPLIAHDGEAVFAELAILRFLLKHGWQGRWVETYGGPNFLRVMPDNWKLRPKNDPLPPSQDKLLREIWKHAKSMACFDVMAWNDQFTVFIEAKQRGKDRLTSDQPKFIEAVLNSDPPTPELIVVEWSYE